MEVLIVDGSTIAGSAIKELLQGRGYQVLWEQHLDVGLGKIDELQALGAFIIDYGLLTGGSLEEISSTIENFRRIAPKCKIILMSEHERVRTIAYKMNLPFYSKHSDHPERIFELLNKPERQ